MAITRCAPIVRVSDKKPFQRHIYKMNKTFHIIIGTSAVSLLAWSAFSQETPNPRADPPNYTRDRMPHAGGTDRLNGAAKATDVIGMTVKNYQDEKLGKVEDIAI